MAAKRVPKKRRRLFCDAGCSPAPQKSLSRDQAGNAVVRIKKRRCKRTCEQRSGDLKSTRLVLFVRFHVTLLISDRQRVRPQVIRRRSRAFADPLRRYPSLDRSRGCRWVRFSVTCIWTNGLRHHHAVPFFFSSTPPTPPPPSPLPFALSLQHDPYPSNCQEDHWWPGKVPRTGLPGGCEPTHKAGSPWVIGFGHSGECAALFLAAANVRITALLPLRRGWRHVPVRRAKLPPRSLYSLPRRTCRHARQGSISQRSVSLRVVSLGGVSP